MLSLMDEIFCFQCFCTEKYEKCVRPDKDLSLKAAPQGRENVMIPGTFIYRDEKM